MAATAHKPARPLTVADVAARISDLALPGYGDDEVQFMATTVLLARPPVIYEWGTNRGASARIFHEAVQMFGLHTEIHTTDLPDEQAHLDRDHAGPVWTGMHLDDTNVVCRRGDGVSISLGQHRRLGSPPRCLFYLDGDHSYEAVTRELYAVTTDAPDAVILCHDSGHLPAVRNAIRDFMTSAGTRYLVRHLESQAGMTRLWPTLRLPRKDPS